MARSFTGLAFTVSAACAVPPLWLLLSRAELGAAWLAAVSTALSAFYVQEPELVALLAPVVSTLEPPPSEAGADGAAAAHTEASPAACATLFASDLAALWRAPHSRVALGRRLAAPPSEEELAEAAAQSHAQEIRDLRFEMAQLEMQRALAMGESAEARCENKELLLEVEMLREQLRAAGHEPLDLYQP